MKLLLDENLSPRLAEDLRRKGFDVLSVHDVDLAGRGKPDAQVLEWAADHDRIVVTYDITDFADLARAWSFAGRPSAGVLFLARKRHPPTNYGALVAGLEKFLMARAGEPWTPGTCLFL